MIRSLILFSIMTMTMSMPQKSDVLYYASLNYAIQEGQYDGVTTVEKLKTVGDFGLGSQEKLIGELVLLDGEFYGIPADGKAKRMRDEDQIAFAAVKFFQAEKTIQVKNIKSLDELQTYLSTVIDQNAFAAIRIRGKFNHLNFRSFKPQAKPYKPVDDVAEIHFTQENKEGTMVGFFTPKSSIVLNSPNYHFHYIDQQKNSGGHVHDCDIEHALIEVDYASELHVLLPQPQQIANVNLNKPIPEEKASK